MRILLLNQFFYPDISATAQMATELAVDLVAMGHQVRVVAAQGSYLGGPKLPAQEQYQGVEIFRVPTTSLGKGRTSYRVFDYVTFLGASTVRASFTRDSEVVIAMCTPPMLVTAAAAAARLRRAKLVYWVQDVYPDLAAAFGILSEKGLGFRVLRRALRTALQHCDLVITLGHAMAKRIIGAGALSERVHVAPNWADGKLLSPVKAGENRLRTELVGSARVAVMYSGNMGRAHDIETLLDAARILEDRSDIVFVFVGSGEKRRLVESASRQLPNVRLAPYQDRQHLAASLSAGDIHLVSLAPEALGLIEPSKVYGVMAVQRPVVFVGPGESEVAISIANGGSGFVVPNARPQVLADRIVYLADNPADRETMGARARRAFENHHERKIATRRFADVLGSLVA
jgi:colanic acid biosynthesis glycosyl transferase WcaI